MRLRPENFFTRIAVRDFAAATGIRSVRG
jgi:hypothetical protein